MTITVVHDPQVLEELRAKRKKLGQDRWDEVWDGVERVAPGPGSEHQRFALRLASTLLQVIDRQGLGQVWLQMNVGDPVKGLKDFRIPDISVVLAEGRAEVRPTYIAGGPDLVIEVRSPDDATYDKLSWYAGQGVREALIIDRDSKALDPYRLEAGKLVPAGGPDSASLATLPLRFERFMKQGRPAIRIVHTESHQVWDI